MKLLIDFHFYITYKCNAKCKHCNVDASPERDEAVDIDDAKRYIDDALTIGKIENFIITGGEPLLYTDRVLEIATFAKSRGIKSRISTNAFWATSVEKARSMIRLLKEAGTVHLWISADAFHAEFVPFERIRNVIQAAKEETMAFYVQSIYLFPDTDIFGDVGVYEGAIRTEYDLRTKAIQQELKDMLPPGAFGWGRVVFTERAVSLKENLGKYLPKVEKSLNKALAEMRNRDVRIERRIEICIDAYGKGNVNGKEIEVTCNNPLNEIVTEYCLNEGVAMY